MELPFAVSRYPTSRYSLVEASPQTGRRNQIRRHFKHIFHPLIGDVDYGEGRHNRFFREELSCRRLLLHAAELTFLHPADGRQMIVRAPLDGLFKGVVERLGWLEAVPEGGWGDYSYPSMSLPYWVIINIELLNVLCRPSRNCFLSAADNFASEWAIT